MDNEDLGYVSSSDEFTYDTETKREVNPRDEMELSTLELVQRDIREQIDHLRRIDSIDVKATELATKQQIRANKIAVDILSGAEARIDTTITNIRELYNER